MSDLRDKLEAKAEEWAKQHWSDKDDAENAAAGYMEGFVDSFKEMAKWCTSNGENCTCHPHRYLNQLGLHGPQEFLGFKILITEGMPTNEIHLVGTDGKRHVFKLSEVS